MICPNCDADMEELEDEPGYWVCPECDHEEDRS